MASNAPLAASSLYVCDLVDGLGEEELWQFFSNYGEVASVEQIRGESGEAVLVGYTQQKAAEEACCILNFAAVRGKTCRCLTDRALEAVRQTMGAGQRLVFERLDPEIDNRGLHDVCSLFGEVLDCKVEASGQPGSMALGFAHFAREEEAAKAAAFLADMQLGSCALDVRPFEPADAVLFTGCRYTPNGLRTRRMSRSDSCSETEDEPDMVPGSPEALEKCVTERFRSLEYHHMEVIEELTLKLERLKTLVQLYDPSHELQMVVVALPANMPSVVRVLSECLEPCDYGFLEVAASQDDRKNVVEGYETGNLYVVALSSEVCTRREYDLGRPPSVLINFDCPSSVQLHLHRLFKRADSKTRVHNFFSPTADSTLALPLLEALEEAGHEIPPQLLEMWSAMDQRTLRS